MPTTQPPFAAPMMAPSATAGLNSMARLPSEGDSAQIRSSESVQNSPSLSLALAVGKMKEDGGDHEAVVHVDVGDAPDEPLDGLVPDTAREDAHEVLVGLGTDQKGQDQGVKEMPFSPPILQESTAELVPRNREETGQGDAADELTKALDTLVPDTADVQEAHQVKAGTLEDEKALEENKTSNLLVPSGTSTFPPHTLNQKEENGTIAQGDGTGNEYDQHLGGPATPRKGGSFSDTADAKVPRIDQLLRQVSASTLPGADDNTLCSTVETRDDSRPFVQAVAKIQSLGEKHVVGTNIGASEAITGEETAKGGGVEAFAGQQDTDGGGPSINMPSPVNQDEAPRQENDGGEVSESNPQQQEVFMASDSFTGARAGYVFKMGSKGLGFYIEGYVAKEAKGKPITSHRPWNAGPGGDAINSKRPSYGPLPKPSKKIVPFLTRVGKIDAAASDARPFMARMVAQKNSRGFQSGLFEREHALDKHILQLLQNFSEDPTFFKKKHGYNIHGQMLGKDGKMIVKAKPEKTAEEKARLPWYRKVYEDRLGKHLPSKRLGDSIEARREAYAYSRHFTAGLNSREEELNEALAQALKGQTKLEFVTEDYQYPGAYDLHGKVILAKGVPISNELHRTDEQNERACTHVYKATQRYRAAHEDIVSAISKKDKALQKVLRKSDAATLLEISAEAMASTGMGIYRQKKKAPEGSEEEAGEAQKELPDRPEQLRQKFAQSLKTEMEVKDKALLKEISALDEAEADQMVDGVGKGAEVLPNSWRKDPKTLKAMQRRRKQLLTENEADRRKVVCPWRPGGQHIAHEPWKPFIPRDHRPTVRCASEGKAGTHDRSAEVTATTPDDGVRGSVDGPSGGQSRAKQRPHTAPTHRRKGKGFMDAISPRARRVLAAQTPGTPLHAAFATYSTDPFPLETTHRSNLCSVSPRTEYSVHGFPSLHGSRTDTLFQATTHRAWAEISSPSALERDLRGGSSSRRPHSAAADVSSKVPTFPRRPVSANETRETATGSSGNAAAPEKSPESDTVPSPSQTQNETSRDLHVPGGPGVTVLWARLCAPSSDLVYKRSVCPKAPDYSHDTRRRFRPKRSAKAVASPTDALEAGREQEQASALPEAESSAPTDTSRASEKIMRKKAPRSADRCPLEDLEDSLFASSSQRVNQRTRVFRGYAERSRRARTWDPGSVFFAEGASKHHVGGPRSCNSRRRGGRRGGACGTPSAGVPTSWKHQRNRRRESQVSADVQPVEMDWEKVDIRRFEEATKNIEEALGSRLFAVATHPEHLDECFQEARELVDSASTLLGSPDNKQARSRKQIDGHAGIGNYVATLSRLNVLWTAAGGVVEIIRMLQRRRDVLEAFCSEQDGLSATDHPIPLKTDPGCSDSSMPPTPAIGVPAQEHQRVQYERREELAELATAIQESVELWVSFVPWRVQVLFGDKSLLSDLQAEEKMLPWPPNLGQYLESSVKGCEE